MKIAANYIVKNEEMFLPYSLKSIENVVDEIIFIDNGSEDNSLQIAKDFAKDFKGRMVIEQITDSDKGFAELRNIEKELTKSDYILIVDGDEVHYISGQNNFYNVLSSIQKLNETNPSLTNQIVLPFYHFYGSFYYVLAQNVDPVVRILKNVPEIEWVYPDKELRVHEKPIFKPNPSMQLTAINYKFAHYGYCKPNKELSKKGKHYLSLGHFNHLASMPEDNPLKGTEIRPFWWHHPSAMNSFPFEKYKTNIIEKGGRFYIENKHW